MKEKGEVDILAPADPDDLAHGICADVDVLEGNGEDTEEDGLDGDAGGVPEEPANAKLSGDIGTRKERGGPGPSGDITM